CNLVRDRLNARAPHPYAGTDRINPRIVTADSDLGTHPRIAGGPENLDQALPHLGHFELEELDQKFRRRAGQKKLGPAGLGAHFLEERLDPVLRLYLLAGNHIGSWNEALRIAAEIDVNTVPVHPLDHAADELPHAVPIRIDDLGALRLADLLHNDLLRLLGGYPAKRHRLHRLLDVAADLDRGI